MTTEELKRVNLVEVLTQEWGMSFRQEGSGFVALSPFSEETKASFYVGVGHDGHWIYCDHSDGSCGSIIDLMMRRLGSSNFTAALKAAREMVAHSGLSSPEPTPLAAKMPMDFEPLYRQLQQKDATPCGDYLKSRGIAPELIAHLIAEGSVVLNIHDASRYCCFAVRDQEGALQGLFSRLIDGPAERKRFLLGRAYPFCSDWKALGQADEVYLCEAIIDALSILTLDSDACVLAVPGAHFDLSKLQLPEDAALIDAFDADEAGLHASARLRELHPNRSITRFQLKDSHDVNDYLLKTLCARETPGRLTPQDRANISIDPRSSRIIAAEYGIHHSRVCDIRKEAAEALKRYWVEKRLGRKPAPAVPSDVQKIQEDLAHQTRRADFLEMRRDYLKLQLDFAEERAEEARKEARRERNRKKKARSKRKGSSK